MIRLTAYLKPISLATVGYLGGTTLGVDIPLIRINNRPYIPGSSIKGALRSSASRIAEAYGFTSCGSTEPRMIEETHKMMNKSCDVCMLFGEPRKDRGRVIVSDFHPVNNPRVITITRVKMEDSTQKAMEGGLYKMEHVEPGSVFKGCISVVDPIEQCLGLLLLSMAELRMGRLGRRTLVDLRVEAGDEIRKMLSRRWFNLLMDLGDWLW